MKTPEIVELIASNEVKEIALQFVDINGGLHTLWVPGHLYEKVAEDRPDLLRRFVFATGDLVRPDTVTFLILADFVPHDLITISSRCARIDFRAIGADVIAAQLVAEGIEDMALLDAARSAGFDRGQGFLMGVPASRADRNCIAFDNVKFLYKTVTPRQATHTRPPPRAPTPHAARAEPRTQPLAELRGQAVVIPHGVRGRGVIGRQILGAFARGHHLEADVVGLELPDFLGAVAGDGVVLDQGAGVRTLPRHVRAGLCAG